MRGRSTGRSARVVVEFLQKLVIMEEIVRMNKLMKRLALVGVVAAFLSLVCGTALSAKLTEMVPMRDGVKLAADVYLPKGEGPWPAVLTMTPYNKNNFGGMSGEINRKGFALVAQDIRGRFASEGADWPVFSHNGWGEIQDGYDTIEWIAKQKWCNGKVGTFGGSAGGILQNMTAPSRPPHLVCQYVQVAFSSMYHQGAYPGGAFLKNLVLGWLEENRFSPENLKMIREHPEYDELWKQLDAERVASKVNVPAMFFGGWYDIFNQGTINSFVTIQNGGDKGAKGRCKLVMGPWAHGMFTDLVYPKSQPPAMVDSWKWFDLWLNSDGETADGIRYVVRKGDTLAKLAKEYGITIDEITKANEIEDPNRIAARMAITIPGVRIPPVHYYVMGDPSDPKAPGNEWRTADAWPIPAKPTPLYLAADGSLSRVPPKEKQASRSFQYDPKNPVPTVGGANLLLPLGPKDQRGVENRPDVLVFTSEVLPTPIEVTGRVKVVLWASSSGTDTDFTAKLSDVYPDGRSMLVLDGIIRARYRNGFEKSELMKPGEVYKFEIDLWSTSILFNRGHRIRVAISSSNSPRFEPNPNTGEHSGLSEKSIVATNTIYFDASRPSYILLPIPTAAK
jgi:hypothetical protein